MLYSAKVKAKDANYSRKYRLDIDEENLNADRFAIRVEVTSSKTRITQVYKISSHTTVNDNIIVAKLKSRPH